ncbi:MAG TPA: hypothetical protein PKL83_05975 [bacterium]|nr:hypothetical protein [bacterium]
MNDLYKDTYRINTTRLRGWDYSQSGYYPSSSLRTGFVTICTKNKVDYFGDIVDGKMCLSDIGKIVQVEWLNTENVRNNIALDEFVIMPDHLHGILIINNVNTIYYDRIIRNEPELERIRQYIANNPFQNSIDTDAHNLEL